MPDPQHASSVPINGPAPYCTSYAINFATTVLTTVVGRPNHAAQVVEFFNEGTTTEDAVFLDVNGTSHTEHVGAGLRYSPPIAVSSIQSGSGANVSAKAFWWPTRGHTVNAA